MIMALQASVHEVTASMSNILLEGSPRTGKLKPSWAIQWMASKPCFLLFLERQRRRMRGFTKKSARVVVSESRHPRCLFQSQTAEQCVNGKGHCFVGS